MPKIRGFCSAAGRNDLWLIPVEAKLAHDSGGSAGIIVERKIVIAGKPGSHGNTVHLRRGEHGTVARGFIPVGRSPKTATEVCQLHSVH